MRHHSHDSRCHPREHRDHRDHFFIHAIWHAIGRHRHGHHGRWDPGTPAGLGGDGDGMPRGRRFSSEDLQLLLLALIGEQPSHGYELIKALDARSNGFYAPSPGMVYPALTYLEELGFVTVVSEGNRKRYELSETGRQHLAEHRERVDAMLAGISQIASKMDSVRRAFAGEEATEPGEGRGWARELIEARHALKRAVRRHDFTSATEQQRVAAILARAAAEIERGSE